MLISEPIEVELEETPGGVMQPSAFVWRGERYEIAEILRFWFDTGFGAGTRSRSWLSRHHRNCYRVRASDGRIYEFYLDRAGGRREWHLYKCLTPDLAGDGENR